MQTNGFNRRDVLRAAAAGLAVYGSTGHAQGAWPSKPVTLVVPFPAGGGTDAFARPLAAQFTRLAGKALVIDNRGGAGGTLGAGATRCSWGRCTTPSRPACTPSWTTTSKKTWCP